MCDIVMKLYKRFKRIFFGILSIRMVYNGYVIKAAMKWKRSVISNLVRDWRTSLLEKIRSYVLGYLPYQRKLFKVNFKNRKDFLSYKKYLYLKGINGKYSKWLSDVITTDQVLKDFRQYFPKLYYHIYYRDGKLKIVALKENLKETETAFFDLIKSKGNLKIINSKNTFEYSISFENKHFYVGEVLVKENEILNIIKTELETSRSLILIENIESREDFRIEGHDSSLYLKVYNKDGTNPLIGEIYCSIQNDFFIDNQFSIDNIDEESILESYSVENYLYTEDDEIKEKVNKSRIYFDEHTGKFKFCVAKDSKKVVKFKNVLNDDNIIRIVENNYDEIKKLVVRIFKTIPQIELAGIELTITNDGIKIINIMNNPPYCDVVYFNKDFHSYLIGKYDQKRQLYKSVTFKLKIFKKKVYLKICKVFAVLCYPKGLVPYLSFRWLRDIKEDFLENKHIPLKDKLWAYKHGFLSYRLAQYGIDKKNYKNFISDFEYRWLRHIDNYYKIWFEDKITIKYVASSYNRFFPKFYYFVSLKQGKNKIIPLMDCPKEYGDKYEDIFNLVKKEKDIALKRDKGSHGEGFYRLSYLNNKFYLNLEETTKQKVIDILSDKNNEYLITEYIKQHPVINDIYSGSVNTIRIIVYKKDGKTPIIGNAYMRFGSSKTGTVDNIGAGGIFVTVDEDTGYFHDALIITEDRKIVPIKEHPDSHLPIEGYIPNWKQIVSDIKEVASYLKQIEYFGFDIAVTEDGIKFPEINRYPDYMKIGKLKEHSIEYLLSKLEEKKKRYGYDKKMPHKIFRFIDRRD